MSEKINHAKAAYVAYSVILKHLMDGTAIPAEEKRWKMIETLRVFEYHTRLAALQEAAKAANGTYCHQLAVLGQAEGMNDGG
ncbi:MAG: hypothetical protein DRI24_17020 [Deltaproteobacteria bacterium]|nr:MAG: hypothetical protein DRI24_17020 [Deltaproteobacteria bacterium]